MKVSLATASLLASTVMAVEFKFINKCDYTIKLHAGGSVFICDIPAGETRAGNCGANLGELGLFKHTAANDVNLLEYSLKNSPGFNNVWYDVSNIPPGPGNCGSYHDCKAATGKTGYNVPILVKPTKHNNKKNCRDVNVDRADSPEAYLFPADNGKVADCPMDEVFEVTYCPDGNSGPAPGPAPGPNPGPNPAPKPAPTPNSHNTTAPEHPTQAPEHPTPVPSSDSTGKGTQFAVCTSNSDCAKGFYCLETNDRTFSMCQPTIGHHAEANDNKYETPKATDAPKKDETKDKPSNNDHSSNDHKATTSAPSSDNHPGKGGAANDNGAGLWGGKVSIVNKLPAACKYTKKSATWFAPGNGRGDLEEGASIGLGPFQGGYTLGLQENVFANCAYAGDCAWNNKAADQYCYNFSLQKDCSVKYNDCPFPPGKNGKLSPAPDGRKRYSITGAIDGDTCVLTVTSTGGGEFFCDASM